MAAAVSNLVHQVTTGTGTGNLTLSTLSGKQSFDTAFGHAATTNFFYYFISNQSAAEWEVGTGHMSDATTLVRDTVLLSTNANAAVSFSAGTKDVTCDLPASMQDVHAASAKAPVDADEFSLLDSAAAFILKKVTGTNLKAYLKTYFDTLYDWATALHAASAKTTPVDADEWGITDSAASFVIKKVTGTNLKAYLKTYFDTLYGSGTPTEPQGRLTLQTAVPVMSTTQSAKTTLYYTPYAGGYCPIYNGTSFTMTAFTELSIATTDTTKNPAAIGASKVNDWFVWNDSGTMRLSHGPDWTSDTARSAGTALTMVNGINLNNASITNGPAASRGTYVGTTRSNGSSQLDWIFGAAANPGTAALLNVWNAYNRVDVSSIVEDTNTSIGGNTTTRSWHNSTNNRVSFVSGLAEDGILVSFLATFISDQNGASSVGFGLDSTSAFTKSITSNSNNAVNIGGFSVTFPFSASGAVAPQLGAHFLQLLENMTASFVGSSGSITVKWRA